MTFGVFLRRPQGGCPPHWKLARATRLGIDSALERHLRAYAHRPRNTAPA